MTGVWQSLGTLNTKARGVLIRNVSASAFVEVGDPAQAAVPRAYGWYRVPPNSTIFIPFPYGAMTSISVLGTATEKIYWQAVRVND